MYRLIGSVLYLMNHHREHEVHATKAQDYSQRGIFLNLVLPHPGELHVIYRTYLVRCDYSIDLPVNGNNLLKLQKQGK